MTKVPRQVRIEHHHAVEMVCGECTTVTHDVYKFELPSMNTITTGRFWKRKKIHSGDFAILAKCTICAQVRPLDARANQWLYDIKAISQSEYLSWAQ
jgi:hypothetical protein